MMGVAGLGYIILEPGTPIRSKIKVEVSQCPSIVHGPPRMDGIWLERADFGARQE